MSSSFFINTGPHDVNYLLSKCDIKIHEKFSNDNILDIKDLSSASSEMITFFHSKKYASYASKTKATYCLTNKMLSQYLPSSCKKIYVDNVLTATAKITKFFYPDSITDDCDSMVKDISKTTLINKVKHGKNVLIGTNVTIGKNFSIGHNSILESNVVIGDNCSVGSNTIIRNSIIHNNVCILDGCVIGKKGFGFFPSKNSNFRYPHIGIVIINDNSEIGCGATIDRGSMSNTVIGKNTYIDNQVHVAHNCKIGDNCIIAGQVGFAGSSIIGDNVMSGGQAGISGHIKIGNNVKIAGGSGVIKDIKNNSKVMGYPAIDLKTFIKNRKQ